MDARTKLTDFLGLQGKTAFVTGAAMGIGKAIALRLSELGAHTVVADIDDATAEKTAALIARNGGSGETAHLDVSDGAAVKDTIDRVARVRDGLDILVNNAGIYPIRNFLESDDALWQKTIEINVMGTARCARAAIPSMKKRGGGVIINLASISGFQPHGEMVHYDTSKAGIVMMTRALAWELRGSGIRVNAVAPGGIQTPGTVNRTQSSGSSGAMDAAALQAYAQAFMARIPLGRMGSADDVARAVAFLATPMSSYVNGAVVVIDGGFLCS